MFEVTHAIMAIKVRSSLNEKLKHILGLTAGITHLVFEVVQKKFWELCIHY